ncbi:hypothetical protein Pfo_020389, partial [Paulownia fortunei]
MGMSVGLQVGPGVEGRHEENGNVEYKEDSDSKLDGDEDSEENIHDDIMIDENIDTEVEWSSPNKNIEKKEKRNIKSKKLGRCGADECARKEKKNDENAKYKVTRSHFRLQMQPFSFRPP